MIVITGGTGLLGGHLLIALAKENLPVRVILRKGTDPMKVFQVWKHYPVDLQSMLNRFEWFEADLINKAEVPGAFEKATQVYHCAGLISFGYGKRRSMWETNVEATSNIVNVLMDLPGVKLVHVSSIAAIGPAMPDEPCSELSGWPVAENPLYTKTKTRGELEVWRGIAEGLNAAIVNPSIILGPAKWNTSTARIFDTIYKGLGFYTLGVNGYVDARDVADAMIRLMHSTISGERYILNACNISFHDLFTNISSALHVKPPSYYANPFLTSLAWRAEFLRMLITGRDPVITRTSMRSAHAKQFYSAEKFSSQLGFTFRNINETIEHTAQCYLKEH
jgi:dihydroflavonol-4-reductase